jgi:thioredoxin-related protein
VSTSFASLVLGTLAVLSAPAATTGGDNWIADFDAAVEVARKEGKDLFVDFTGSDWCGWCKRLDAEVFSHDAFLEPVRKDFVLVALDFPSSEEVKAKVPDPARNEELKEKYGIQGFPTILLMNADGEVYAQTGYREGGPEKYVEHLDEIRSTGREALVSTKQLVAEFDAAQGEAKVAALGKVLDLLGKLDADSPFAAQLAAPARWAFEADPDNAKGLKLRAVKTLMAAGQMDETVTAAARDLDPDNAEGLLEQVVDAQFMAVNDDASARAALAALEVLAPKGFQDKELGYRLHFTAARWCSGPLDDPEGVQRHGKAAQAIGTDDEQLAEALEQLLAG